MPRPAPRFRDFIGQKAAVDRLRRQLEGAQDLREPFPHTMFIGPSGIGKTRLAEALAAEASTQVVKVMGHSAPEALADRAKDLRFGDFLFIDEAQNLPPLCQEMLLHLIDEWRLSIPKLGVGGRVRARMETEEIAVEPHTVILATDRPGKLINALQKRMALPVRLGYYGQRELKEIVDRIAADLDMYISPQAAGLLAQISAGLPRRAKHHLENLRRHVPGARKQQITIDHVRRFLTEFGVDDHGLGEREREYLSYLAEMGAASLESLALCLGVDVPFVRQQIEPVLQRQRLIVIGPGGRKLTPLGHTRIKMDQQTFYDEE